VKPERIVIISASSDIGSYLANRYLHSGSEVVGTYRNRTKKVSELESAGVTMLKVDIASPEQIESFAASLRHMGFKWDTLISAAGVLEPIGKFFSLDFDVWERSVLVNSTAQLRILHAIHDSRSTSNLCKVIFFSGGGTNSPFDNYSAYCVGKIALIKMTELLDSEYPELQISIIGTGWVNTKIHRQTIEAGTAAGDNLDKTRVFLASKTAVGASLDDVFECVSWCLDSERSALGGRNISLAHDPWREADLPNLLQSDPNMYKLRRRS